MKHTKLLMTILFALGASTAWSAGTPAAPAAAAAPFAGVKGKVLEVRDVPSYTYLRIQTTSGEVWAAVPTVKVAVGSEVTVEGTMLMRNFESQTLKRKFDQIYFGNLPRTTSSAPAAAAAPPAAPDTPVAKASGANARTVAEVNTNATALKDKPVLVRARVVKYNAGIMGKNWIHLRDGSGSAGDASNDLLATTQGDAKIGEVLLVKGTVRNNKDFGGGYSYKVLIEDATLQR